MKPLMNQLFLICRNIFYLILFSIINTIIENIEPMIQPEKYFEYINVAYNSNINSLYETFANPQDCNTKNCNLNPDITSRDCNSGFELLNYKNSGDNNGFGCGNTNNFISDVQNANDRNDEKKRQLDILNNLQCIANQFSKISKYRKDI